MAICLFVFFFVVACTGLLLGWKKNSGGLLLPNTEKGSSPDLNTWLPLDSLHRIAVRTLHQKVSPAISAEMDRIDARVQKGTVKFLFIQDNWEVQLDGSNGKVLNVQRRYSDLVEQIHDGTILDRLFNTKHDQLKLIYSSVMGSALLLFILSGMWLWYGPKRLRNKKRAAVNNPH